MLRWRQNDERNRRDRVVARLVQLDVEREVACAPSDSRVGIRDQHAGLREECVLRCKRRQVLGPESHLDQVHVGASESASGLAKAVVGDFLNELHLPAEKQKKQGKM